MLHDGDIVSLDVGVKYEGYYTDSATTVAVGAVPDESQRLLDVTQEALAAGIEAAQPGNHVGDIGAAIQAVVERRASASSATSWGTGSASRFTRSRRCRTTASRERGTKLVPGLTIAIEPMVNVGGPATRTMPDDGRS